MSIGTYLIQLLTAHGVDTVFGIPGVHTVELYRGLANSTIRHVTPRHEQGAGFMADGYARASGKVGVCFIITGPGITNSLTAMAQAYGDSIPMLVISTVNAHGHMGSGEGWLHELPDQQALVSGVTAFSRTIHHPDELEPAMAQAFAVFETARPRPVHLELPIDVLQSGIEHLPLPATHRRALRPAPDRDALVSVAKQLSAARTPVVLAGGGARTAMSLTSLAEALDAPVVMTTNARGLLAVDHPLGVSLSASLPETRQLISSADVVLALGTELGPTDYDMYEDGGFSIPGTLLRIDIDPLQLRRGPRAELALVGDVNLAVDALLANVVPRGSKDGASRASAARQGRTQLSAAMQGDLYLLELIRDTLPDALIIGDSTQLVYAGNLGFSASVTGGYFNSATGYGTLGYALPAAIGASLGTQRPIVAIMGDGGLQFVLGELTSAVEANTPLIMILHDNQGYGEIKSFMQQRDIEPIGVDILTPDLGAVAAACHWEVHRLRELAELPDRLHLAIHSSRPSLVIIDDTLRQQASAIARK